MFSVQVHFTLGIPYEKPAYGFDVAVDLEFHQGNITNKTDHHGCSFKHTVDDRYTDI